jgi:hypothetical protein
MPKDKMDITAIKQIVSQHNNYWDAMAPDIKRWRAAYLNKFWDESNLKTNDMVLIQVAQGYAHIEQYQASLFAKNPAVDVEPGLRAKGDNSKAEIVVNEFLLNCRNVLENASRMGLIYPNSFMKLIPQDTDSLYDKIALIALPPWEVIIDTEALRWDDQHYTGHIYWMTEGEAKVKFGSKDFNAQNKTDYLNKEIEGSVYKYIQVVELYDYVNNKLYFWSPNYASGNRCLEVEKFIPFTNYDGKAFAPIAPLYYNRQPDIPLIGYSTLARVYDQIFEQNIIRTFQANAVRKASRQWLVQKGKLDEEDLAQLQQGVDGLFLEVELEDRETLSGMITPVPHQQTPPEVQHYYNEVMGDENKGSILAPFTRGEATKASATEASALIFYNSSEIGRLARERDACVEQLSSMYLDMLSMYITDAKKENKSTLIKHKGKLVAVTEDDLKGDFRIFASDSSSTPMSDIVVQQNFIQNIPMLISLGVPKEKVLAKLVDSLKLPADFKDTAPPMLPPQDNVPGAGGELQQTEEQILQEAVINPSAANAAKILSPDSGLLV